MKKQLWQKAIVGTLLATSLATPIALAQTTDSLNTTSAGKHNLLITEEKVAKAGERSDEVLTLMKGGRASTDSEVMNDLGG